MKDFVTSDLHLFHDVILTYRKYKSHNKHNEDLIFKWNQTVSKHDRVFILGDLTLKKGDNRSIIENVLNRLNGTKILILGNHDEFKPFTYIDMGFQSVHTSLMYRDDILMIHDPAVSTFVPNLTVLCGHVHELFTREKNCINVGLDVRFMQPVLIDALLLEKDIEYYCGLNYEVQIRKLSESEGGGYFAEIPLLGNAAYNADGETKWEAINNLNHIKRYLFQQHLNLGHTIPEN